MAAKSKVRDSELARAIERIEGAVPKASLLYARIVVALLDATDRTMTVSDLSDAIGRGRDSSAVQLAIGRLCDIGLVERELMPAEEGHGRHYIAKLRPVL